MAETIPTPAKPASSTFDLPWDLPPPPQPPPALTEAGLPISEPVAVTSADRALVASDGDHSQRLPWDLPPPAAPPPLAPESCAAAFGRLDVNNDGKISREEFVLGITATPGISMDPLELRDPLEPRYTADIFPSASGAPVRGELDNAFLQDWQLQANEALIHETSQDFEVAQHQLAAAQDDLELRKIRLGYKRQQIETTQSEITSRQKQIQLYENDIVADEEQVQLQELQLDSDSQHLKRCENALRAEALRVKQRRDELEKSEPLLRQKEQELARQQEDLSKLGREVAEAEQDVYQRNADMTTAETELRRRRLELTSRQSEVNADRRMLSSRENEFDQVRLQQPTYSQPVYSQVAAMYGQPMAAAAPAAAPAPAGYPTEMQSMQQNMALQMQQTQQMLQMQQFQQLQRFLMGGKDPDSERQREREHEDRLKALEARIEATLEKQEGALAAVMEAAILAAKETQEATSAMVTQSAEAAREAAAAVVVQNNESISKALAAVNAAKTGEEALKRSQLAQQKQRAKEDRDKQLQREQALEAERERQHAERVAAALQEGILRGELEALKQHSSNAQPVSPSVHILQVNPESPSGYHTRLSELDPSLRQAAERLLNRQGDASPDRLPEGRRAAMRPDKPDGEDAAAVATASSWLRGEETAQQSKTHQDGGEYWTPGFNDDEAAEVTIVEGSEGGSVFSGSSVDENFAEEPPAGVAWEIDLSSWPKAKNEPRKGKFSAEAGRRRWEKAEKEAGRSPSPPPARASPFAVPSRVAKAASRLFSGQRARNTVADIPALREPKKSSPASPSGPAKSPRPLSQGVQQHRILTAPPPPRSLNPGNRARPPPVQAAPVLSKKGAAPSKSPSKAASASSKPFSSSSSADPSVKAAAGKGAPPPPTDFDKRRALTSRPLKASASVPRSPSENRGTGASKSPGRRTPLVDELLLATSQDEVSPIATSAGASSPSFDRNPLEAYLPRNTANARDRAGALPLFVPGSGQSQQSSSGSGRSRSGAGSGRASTPAQPWWESGLEFPANLRDGLREGSPLSPGLGGFHEVPAPPFAGFERVSGRTEVAGSKSLSRRR
eukprot:TRINITY_DN4119_c0_g1_i1.p1 TRINITY_DN4119_c0_g1~~TRINITY_DN4119_c0_g1_i1.p1  ORF type:complete len:1075 (-),score=240.45 TRINITY_DN4119_c0_g1_i1:51-3275(-)